MQTTGRMLEFDPRYWRTMARAAIRDVCDALVELITNADDRYVHLAKRGQFTKPGLIEIEVERKRKGGPSTVRVRDFADGMTDEVMSKKLARVGARVSGMAEGVPVRGTYSRGAKDIAVLGGVTFESIGQDGRYHKCEISARGQFIPYPSAAVTKAHRKELGIPEGTGTLVTLAIDQAFKVPQHETLRGNLRDLVPLRDILSSPERRVVLMDLSKGRENVLEFHPPEGKNRLSERLALPGYEKADAKLVIYRASQRLERGSPRFRIGGILIRSRRAIHEATLFAPELEHDPHAAWFFGKLTCEYIDVLSNDLDDRMERDLEPSSANPRPVVDPARRSGLDREHPFVQALFKEVLKRLMPLVEEERKREESTKTNIESDETRRRLRALEKAAADFMAKYREEEDMHSRSSEDTVKDSFFNRKGYSLNPPRYAQILVGHGARFWLNINQAVFREFSAGDSIDISYATADLSGPRSCALEQHPNQEGVLRCVWTVKGEKPTKETALVVRLNGIVEERKVEVLASEKEKYSNITDLCFSHKQYSVPLGRSRKVTVLAPYPAVISQEVTCELDCSDPAFRVPSSHKIVPCKRLGVAVCDFHVATDQADLRAKITAKAAGRTCDANLVSVAPSGAVPEVKIEPIDFTNQRYRWHGNIIQVAAFHPSLRRYLGSSQEKFPGQHHLQFRVLLAEIVADAVCSKILERRVIARPEEYEDADWQDYSADFTKLMTEFLPIAHETQIPENELGR